MRAIKGNLKELKQLRKKYTREVKRQEEVKEFLTPPTQIGALSEEDKRLFRQSVKGVTPLDDSKRLDHSAGVLKNPEFYQAKREQAEGAPMLMQPKRTQAKESKPLNPRKIELENDSYLAHGMGKDMLKKLRHGYWSVGATLDLHGATLEQAADRFDRFIGTCLEFNVRCFLIIHGKGHGSKDGKAVLKSYLNAWLRDIEKIAAFVPAPESMGGDGALLVVCKVDKDKPFHA